MTVLIETYWNVKSGTGGKDRRGIRVLIETYWNVKARTNNTGYNQTLY